MKAKIWIRLAFACIVIHFLGHTLGHLSWKEANGDTTKQEVIRQMTDYKFEFMGSSRSFGDYYEGYSLILLVMYLILLSLLWTISSVAAEQKTLSKKLLLPIGIGLLAYGVLEFMYFFPFAASMSTAAGVFTLLGSMRLIKENN